MPAQAGVTDFIRLRGGRFCMAVIVKDRALNRFKFKNFEFNRGLRPSCRSPQSGQVAFDVGHKHRYTEFGKAFGHGLQGDGFAGSGGAGDEPMAVGLVGLQKTLGLAVLGN